jgi:hypothetical protein
MAPFVQARVAAPARAPVNPKHHPRSAARSQTARVRRSRRYGTGERTLAHTWSRKCPEATEGVYVWSATRVIVNRDDDRAVGAAHDLLGVPRREHVEPGMGWACRECCPCSPCRFARTRCHGLGVRGQCRRPPERARMSLDHSCWTLPMEPHVTVMFEACRCTTFHEPDGSDRTNVRRPSARSISR